MKKLSIAYFGTPYFSAQFLEKIITDTTINQLIIVGLVVTRPDQPVGRKQLITKSPVKEIAEKYKIPVIEDLKKLQNTIQLQNCDFAFLYAYGGIIPNSLLHQPRLGFLNTHPSLLPKYRGPSPISSPLIAGDTQTGVTFIQLDDEIDHGPILMQETLAIGPNDRRPDLERKLENLAFQMFSKFAKSLIRESENRLIFKEQDHTKATFTKMLGKKDGYISFSDLQKMLKDSPKILFNRFRGFYPWPGIWTLIQPDRLKWDRPKRLKITDLSLIKDKLIIKKVQLEGKKEVDFETFNGAYKIF